MEIKESIVVEGRDDTAAVKRAVNAQTIETHGFGIKKSTWQLIEKAYQTNGIIVFTDPDYAGEQIRKKITNLFPQAKQAHLSQKDAIKSGDIGIENAAPDVIISALENAHCIYEQKCERFSIDDLKLYGLVGTPGAAEKRDKLGKALGIGYGNSKTFLTKLNQYGINREEFLRHVHKE